MIALMIDGDYSSSIVGWTCNTSIRSLWSYCSSGTCSVQVVEAEEEEGEEDKEEEGKAEPCNNDCCCTVLCSQTLLSGPSVVCLKELRILLR